MTADALAACPSPFTAREAEIGSIWLKEFTAGLDNRRMFEAASGGVLVKANNGHITRGGEFEQRAAFVPEFTLPSGTIGMFATPASITVFGHDAAPTLPTGVVYQRLQHSDSTTALVRVLSTDLYAGQIYAVGEFADGAVFHFYNGARVTDWFDGRARATFAITGGVSNTALPATGSFDITGGSATTPAVAATGGFTVTGGTLGGGNEIATLTVDGVDILGSTVTHTGDNSTTATAIASAINGYTSSPNYSAAAVGAVLTITAATTGTGPNGFVVVATPSGDMTVGSVANMSGGAAAVVNRITEVLVAGVDVLGSAVTHTGDNSTTATAVAAAITSYTSSPEYTAAAVGATVTITAAITGTAANGRVVVPGVDGDATVGSVVNMAGGSASATSRVDDIKVNGISILTGPIDWATSNEATATAVAGAINSLTSSPDYTASAVGASVSIAAVDTGPGPNGFAVTFTLANSLTVDPTTLVMANGADSTNTYQPGEFVKTISQKVYSTSGPNTHFSGIAEPTKWTTDTTGAGFVDMSSESSGSEELTALARYQNFVAVFAATVVQIWFMDPDPALNRLVQILNNTGTASPRSVTAFGNSDLLYLDESGLRSMKARDSSNAAATTDIGVPVDTLITEQLATLDENERRQVVGLIEPRFGRFWLIMRGKVFVFSFFNGAKVSAWSTYDTTYINDDDETVAFDVDDALVFKRRVYLRSGDTIFVYGGITTGATSDATVAEAWLPYLDADDPTRMKQLNGLDLALRGLWSVSAAYDPGDETAEDLVGIYDRTTYNSDTNPFNHQATHVSLRFRSEGVGPHRLGAAVIHYESSDDDD